MKKEVKNLLDRLNEVKKTGDNKYMAKCCCHADDTASLSISVEGDRILINCFAGCKTEDIVNNLGLEMKDLFLGERKENKMQKIVKEYIYTDEENKILNKVVRKEPKGFYQAQYLNGKWQTNMENAKRVPYNLYNVKNSSIIYWVEGEKDADNLNNLGLVATTTPGGASGFNKFKNEYVKYFKEKTVYIIPDNDTAGKNYATNVSNALNKVTNRAVILDLGKHIKDLKDKEDISDIIERYGKDVALKLLEKLIQEADENGLFDFAGQTINQELLKTILKTLNIEVLYNDVTKNIEISGLPSIFSKENAENTLPVIIYETMKKYKIKGTKRDIEDLLILIFDTNKYNPIIDMFQHYKWDKIDRFETLFDILGISDQFLKTLIYKWFLQTSAIVFNGYMNNNFGIEGILTLQGSQGCREDKIF